MFELEGGRRLVLCLYRRVGNCSVVEHKANIVYVTELTCFIFYSAKPSNCSTTWNLTHRFSNEYSEPSLIGRTRFSQLLVSSLDLTFVVSVTTLVSFLLIIRKPPNLHAHRNPAKDFLVLRALVECDYSSLLETSSRVRYPIKSLMISSSDSSESLPRTSLFNLSSILTLICSSWSA